MNAHGATAAASPMPAAKSQPSHLQPPHRAGHLPSGCNTAERTSAGRTARGHTAPGHTAPGRTAPGHTAPGTTPEGYHSDHRVDPGAPARSRDRSTAIHCAIAQPSVKQIDGTTAPRWMPFVEPRLPLLHVELLARWPRSGRFERVAASPTPGDTLHVEGGPSASADPGGVSTRPSAARDAALRSQEGSGTNLGHQLLASRTRPLRRRAAMPSRCKSCCRTQLDVVTVEFGAGGSHSSRWGKKKKAATGTSARRANLHSPFGDHYSLLNDQGRTLQHPW